MTWAIRKTPNDKPGAVCMDCEEAYRMAACDLPASALIVRKADWHLIETDLDSGAEKLRRVCDVHLKRYMKEGDRG